MRKSNIKDSIMMPPPKPRPKSHSDTSEELRRNLIDSNNTSFDNFFQEEMSKISKENEDQNFKNDYDTLSISKSTESYLNEKEKSNNFNNLNSVNSSSFISTYNNQEKENKNNLNTFNFNMVNYLYNDNYENEEYNQEFKKNLEKLKLNLTSSSHLYSRFQSLATPTNKKEIKVFVYNLEKYISDHLFDSNLKNLRIKLQTRYNDFRNKGLQFEYFKKVLEKMQTELISRISKQNNGDKKIEVGI